MRKGQPITDEHRRAIIESNMTRSISDETKQKMSEAAKARPQRELPEGMRRRLEHVFIDGVESKPCSKCKVMKPITEYGKMSNARNGSGLNYRCRECHNASKAAYYHKADHYRNKGKEDTRVQRRIIKNEAVKYLGGKCVDCGIALKELENEYIFDFHHIDPKQKDFNVTSVRARTLDTIKPELDKCVVLCANCHRLRHQAIWKNGR